MYGSAGKADGAFGEARMRLARSLSLTSSGPFPPAKRTGDLPRAPMGCRMPAGSPGPCPWCGARSGRVSAGECPCAEPRCAGSVPGTGRTITGRESGSGLRGGSAGSAAPGAAFSWHLPSPAGREGDAQRCRGPRSRTAALWVRASVALLQGYRVQGLHRASPRVGNGCL